MLLFFLFSGSLVVRAIATAYTARLMFSMSGTGSKYLVIMLFNIFIFAGTMNCSSLFSKNFISNAVPDLTFLVRFLSSGKEQQSKRRSLFFSRTPPDHTDFKVLNLDILVMFLSIMCVVS